MLPLVFKCLVGAVAVLLISLASQSKYFVLAGLVPLFPTFALIAHVILGTTQPAAALQATALFGLWALVPYAAYLSVVYLLSTRTTLVLALSGATFAWIVIAGVTLVLWFRRYPA